MDPFRNACAIAEFRDTHALLTDTRERTETRRYSIGHTIMPLMTPSGHSSSPLGLARRRLRSTGHEEGRCQNLQNVIAMNAGLGANADRAAIRS